MFKNVHVGRFCRIVKLNEIDEDKQDRRMGLELKEMRKREKIFLINYLK